MIIQGNDPFTEPSFSLGNRLARALWGVAWVLLFRPTPRFMHGWRRVLLRLFGAELGQHVNFASSVKVWAPWQLRVGNRVGFGAGVTLYNMAPLRIDDEVVISQGAHICGGTHDIDSPNFQLVAKPVQIGPRAWICADAFVGPGVSIAEGCVIGARAVALKSIDEPWTVWTGNPVVKKRQRQQSART